MTEERQPLLTNSQDTQVYVNVPSSPTYANVHRSTDSATDLHVSFSNGQIHVSTEWKDNEVYETYSGTLSQGKKFERTGSIIGEGLEPVTLTWKNVNVHIDPPNRACCRGPQPGAVSKHVLRNVSGIVKPGTLLAIVGASGSGKTTLLNTLTWRTQGKMQMEGDIRVNGIDVGRGIRNVSAYVQQDDLLIATMTVREHLTFRALLRMDSRITYEQRILRVEEVITELGLTKCADNLIGNPGRIKGISGGEMRRLSFASEVLTNPPLLFCDEATSGLDSFMAENIVQTLRGMAKKGRTILCTIHQPSSEVYALFDEVLVMAEGRNAYMGTTDGALKFFASGGYNCPVNHNPADYYIHTLAVLPGKEIECKTRIELVCDQFDNSETGKQMLQDTDAICSQSTTSGLIFEEAFSNMSRYKASWCRQFATVLKRSWLTNAREPMVIKVRVAQTLLIGIMLGLIYLRLPNDQESVQNYNGVLFLLITNMSFTNIFAVVNVFPLELPIFLREYGIGLYRVDVYYICKMLAELPLFVFIPLLFTSICYWMTGLYESAEAFFICCALMVFVANIAASFGYIISSAADSVNTALAIAPPLMIPLLMFGGFFLNADSIPDYFIWLEYLSWFKFANELVTVNQWKHIDSIGCDNSMNSNVTMPPVNPNCRFLDGESVLQYLNFSDDNTVLDLSILAGLLVGFRIIAFIILLIKARRSRA